MDSVTTDNNINANIAALIQRRQSINDPLRKSALEVFQQLGVPPVKSEEFKYTPIMRELEKNFTFRETAVAPVTNDISEFLIPGVDANLLVFVNGVYSPTLSSVKSSKLVIKSLDEALKEKDILAIEHYNQHSGMKSNGLVAWNTADWTSGVFIHVPDNSIVEEP